jgi:hypothetical protein
VSDRKVALVADQIAVDQRTGQLFGDDQGHEFDNNLISAARLESRLAKDPDSMAKRTPAAMGAAGILVCVALARHARDLSV